MDSIDILVTCPPMLRMMDRLGDRFDRLGLRATTPDVVQTLSEEELVELVPRHDGWIIGDDPATRRVFEAGKAGRLRAAVKWGIGVDNVDLQACADLGLPISNTPNMFGGEVADVAMGYVIALARHTFEIDRGVRQGGWPKPAGISLAGKTAALVGYGDIGRATARRLLASDMRVLVYDPKAAPAPEDAGGGALEPAVWPHKLETADFIVITCALTSGSRHMLNADTLSRCKPGVRVVNVSRGPVVDEPALVAALQRGHVHSAALDVFETEPLPETSPLRDHERCVFGSHNASNTVDAVIRTSEVAIDKLVAFLSAAPSPESPAPPKPRD